MSEVTVTKAVKKLIQSHPFYGFFHLSMLYKESNKLPTYAGVGYNRNTNKIELHYNPDLIAKLTLEEAKGLIAHEVEIWPPHVVIHV